MRIRLPAAVMLVLIAGAGVVHAQAVLAPGYWEHEVRMRAFGDKPMVSKQCMSPSETRSVEQVLGDLQDSCTLTRRTLAGGKITRPYIEKPFTPEAVRQLAEKIKEQQVPGLTRISK